MLASLILSGAGQFLAGARRRGIIWFGIVCALPLFLLGIYTSPLVPAKARNSPLGCQHDCMGRDVVRLTPSNSSIALVGLGYFNPSFVRSFRHVFTPRASFVSGLSRTHNRHDTDHQ